MSTLAIEEALVNLHRLEDAINEMTFASGESLRAAVRRFDSEPLSVSSVDAFRECVLRVAEGLTAPLPLPSNLRATLPVRQIDDDTAGTPGHNLRAVESLRVVR